MKPGSLLALLLAALALAPGAAVAQEVEAPEAAAAGRDAADPETDAWLPDADVMERMENRFERPRRPLPVAAPQPASAPAAATGRGAVGAGELAPLPAGELPLWFELPAGVRRELPELAMSVHYYNTDPDRRFVYLAGERVAEGQQTESLLTVREIRRDGVVLQFRDQVFRLER